MLDSDLPRVFEDEMPDHALAERRRSVFRILTLTHTAEQRSRSDAGGGGPLVDRRLHKWRDGDGADFLALAREVDQNRAAFALLDVLALERGEFAPPETAADQHGEDGAVPFAGQRFGIGLAEEIASLFAGQPVPCPGARLPDALQGDD